MYSKANVGKTNKSISSTSNLKSQKLQVSNKDVSTTILFYGKLYYYIMKITILLNEKILYYGKKKLEESGKLENGNSYNCVITVPRQYDID